MAALWAEMFPEPCEVVGAAVKALIATDVKGFPPHIGAIKEQIKRLTAPQELNEAEAWGRLRRAISNGAYDAEAEYDKLPAEIRAIVTPAAIREWALMESETVNSVVASNFQRAWRELCRQKRERAMIPADVLALAAQTRKELIAHDTD